MVKADSTLTNLAKVKQDNVVHFSKEGAQAMYVFYQPPNTARQVFGIIVRMFMLYEMTWQQTAIFL